MASNISDTFLHFTGTRKEESVERSEKETIENLIIRYRVNDYSFDRIANRLNEKGFKTENGGMFYASTVQRLYVKFQNQ